MTTLTLEFLKIQSGLPGPRANLGLLHRFAHEADTKTAAECLAYAEPDVSNSPEEFVGMCGVLAMALLCGDKKTALEFLQPFAAHRSWRIRETVAIALQELSSGGLRDVLGPLERWIHGTAFEQRAAVGGLCEPRLLKDPSLAEPVLAALEFITPTLDTDRKLDEGQEALKKALGYGWSVAVAAFPTAGKPRFESLFGLRGKHIRWIIGENLKKNRLLKLDEVWVRNCRDRLLAP